MPEMAKWVNSIEANDDAPNQILRHNRAMSEILYLSYSPRQKALGETVFAALKGRGYDVNELQGAPKDGSLVMLLLDMKSSEDEFFASAPWLKEQFDYSSLRALRLMPFLVYRSSEGDIEEQVEENLADTLEAVISGEFKPYGYDLDAIDPLKEFASVLENYEE